MLKTILVDDEPLTLHDFEKECRADAKIEVVGTFERASEALAYARGNRVDFALLDIEMPGMNGLTLAGQLREIHPDIIIIFVTGSDKYCFDAVQLKADFYVLKPYTLQDVKEALQRALLLSGRIKKPIYIRAFGNFDLFVNGEAIHFPNKKSKELLALLVDKRGGIVTVGDVISYLWEDCPSDDTTQSYCRKACIALRNTLKDCGAGELFIEHANGKCVNLSAFECDYYKYLQGDADPALEFCGEYMTQYSWGEYTLAALEERKLSSH